MVVAHVEISTPQVLDMHAAASSDEASIGGKASGLVRLAEVGANVPPWFVVPSQWMRRIVARARLAGGDPESVRAAILDAAFPTPLVAQLIAALDALGPGPYAVRSSMSGEDSAKFSYAGQLETFLHQHDLQDVQESLRQCWASALSPRALAYRARTDDAARPPQVAVIVQRMVEGQVSGVAFSAHPSTGRRDHALISGAWGLGEGVVSGECNSDDIVWSHREGLIDYRVACKDRKIVHQVAGVGTRIVRVASAQQDVPCLAGDQLASLGSEVIRIADALGEPQDIEWTLDDGLLYLLQARPITALPVAANHDGPALLFDNSNIQESYCGVTTPLTFSFASAAYANVYEQTFRVLRLTEAEIKAHQPVLVNLLGLVRGRVYYNLENWYRGLLVLPSFGTNKADMERMMGVTEPVDFVEDEVLTLTQKLARLPRLLETLTHLLLQFRKLDGAVATFGAQFEAAYAQIDRPALKHATFSELIDVRDHIDCDVMGRWHTPIINDFFVMMMMGKLRRIVEGTGLESVDEVMSSLLAGEPGIESTEPTRALMRIARDAGDTGAFDQEAIDRYVERYGDRVMGELKLETVTLREDRSFLYKILEGYRCRGDLDPDAIMARERRMRADAERAVRGCLGPIGRRTFTRVLGNARKAVKYRENMRLARTRAFGLYRDVYAAIGMRLHEAGRLDDPRDVFYLTVEEITAYHDGRSVTANVGALAKVRKVEFEAYGDEDLPHRFTTRGPVYHGNRYDDPTARPVDADATDLNGIGCYPGVIEAAARLIMSPDDELDLDGKILVTVRTDPGWAPLFPTCSGILVERGSSLSHSAVVARELGIPAVVGVPNLTKIVRDGEPLRLDGGSGRVQRLGSPKG